MENRIGQPERSPDSSSKPRTSPAVAQSGEENGILQLSSDSVGLIHYDFANNITSSDLCNPGSERHEGQYNGKVLLILPSSSSCWAPGFDFELCRGLLARQGIHIPAEDLDQPLHSSLDRPEVKRYLLFNSTLFHLFLAPLLYLVTWCGLYSTFHLFLQGTLGSFFWLFCLSLSLLSVLLTGMVLLLLNRHTRQINMNTDVQLVCANEGLCKHKVLAGLSDTVSHCTSLHQLFFIYFDLSDCQVRLTELLEEMSFTSGKLQSKLRQKLSHLHLVTHVKADNPSERSEVTESEETPLLLGDEAETGCSTSRRLKGEPELTVIKSLVPTGSAQEMAYQLLLTYSAVYVKLLVAQRLPRDQRHLHAWRANAPCLCQYIEKLLQC
ncbi:transmembrane protein 268 isoform X1 [Polyodon spathula]|uniref:transmembrane protein 268 isoform X1 n=1 Tax=Polyodon spathula TaxID=7913 RepID=UPI001B7ECE54|nr:transmembrane protein 268 isoform X1 [Polyodon spathula]